MPELWTPLSGSLTVVTPADRNAPESFSQLVTIGISALLERDARVFAVDVRLGEPLGCRLERFGEEPGAAQDVADRPQRRPVDLLEQHCRISLIGLEATHDARQLVHRLDGLSDRDQLVRGVVLEAREE
jgi:hypothetical protein